MNLCKECQYKIGCCVMPQDEKCNFIHSPKRTKVMINENLITKNWIDMKEVLKKYDISGYEYDVLPKEEIKEEPTRKKNLNLRRD